MPIVIQHDPDIALVGAVAEQAGRGEFQKYKQEFEFRNEQFKQQQHQAQTSAFFQGFGAVQSAIQPIMQMQHREKMQQQAFGQQEKMFGLQTQAQEDRDWRMFDQGLESDWFRSELQLGRDAQQQEFAQERFNWGERSRQLDRDLTQQEAINRRNFQLERDEQGFGYSIDQMRERSKLDFNNFVEKREYQIQESRRMAPAYVDAAMEMNLFPGRTTEQVGKILGDWNPQERSAMFQKWIGLKQNAALLRNSFGPHRWDLEAENTLQKMSTGKKLQGQLMQDAFRPLQQAIYEGEVDPKSPEAHQQAVKILQTIRGSSQQLGGDTPYDQLKSASVHMGLFDKSLNGVYAIRMVRNGSMAWQFQDFRQRPTGSSTSDMFLDSETKSTAAWQRIRDTARSRFDTDLRAWQADQTSAQLSEKEFNKPRPVMETESDSFTRFKKLNPRMANIFGKLHPGFFKEDDSPGKEEINYKHGGYRTREEAAADPRYQAGRMIKYFSGIVDQQDLADPIATEAALLHGYPPIPGGYIASPKTGAYGGVDKEGNPVSKVHMFEAAGKAPRVVAAIPQSAALWQAWEKQPGNPAVKRWHQAKTQRLVPGFGMRQEGFRPSLGKPLSEYDRNEGIRNINDWFGRHEEDAYQSDMKRLKEVGPLRDVRDYQGIGEPTLRDPRALIPSMQRPEGQPTGSVPNISGMVSAKDPSSPTAASLMGNPSIPQGQVKWPSPDVRDLGRGAYLEFRRMSVPGEGKTAHPSMKLRNSNLFTEIQNRITKMQTSGVPTTTIQQGQDGLLQEIAKAKAQIVVMSERNRPDQRDNIRQLNEFAKDRYVALFADQLQKWGFDPATKTTSWTRLPVAYQAIPDQPKQVFIPMLGTTMPLSELPLGTIYINSVTYTPEQKAKAKAAGFGDRDSHQEYVIHGLRDAVLRLRR